MRYTIMGFSQAKLVEYGLDTVDATLLRYFVDFKESNRMKLEMVEGKAYFWLQYDGVLRELPILKMKKGSVQSRLFKMRDAGVLTHHVKRLGGTYSYFGLGDKYFQLIGSEEAEGDLKEEVTLEESADKEKQGTSISKDMDNNQQPMDKSQQDMDNNQQPMDDNQQPMDNNHQAIDENQQYIDENQQCIDKNQQGCQLKSTTKDSSTKDSSTNNKVVEDTIIEIVHYLNAATGKRFKSSTKETVKLIKARMKEDFTLEDFKMVIDNMKVNWTGTRFQQYLAPTTLFGPKFETYLNTGKAQVKNENKRGNISSYSSSSEDLKGEEIQLILKEDM